MSEEILKVEGVTCDFGGVRALDHVDLIVAPKTVHAVIGPNGAGKTTLIKILTGELQPTRGTVYFGGLNVNSISARSRVRLGMARCFQITSIFESLSVSENVRLAVQARSFVDSFNFLRSSIKPHWTLSRANKILDLVGLGGKGDVIAGTISYGEQRLLEIALALAGEPRLLLLDEPAAGVGLAELPRIKALLGILAREYSIILIEHNVEMVMELSNIVTVLHRGAVLRSGLPKDIARDPEVSEVYFGGG